MIEAGLPVKGTVLFVPGFTGSKEDFIALHEPLAEAGYRSVAVDGRGQYESEGPKEDESPYAQEELAKDLISQARAVSHGAPVHLVGHSLGGQISRAAVLLDTSPFASLTLMASGPAQISASQQQRVKLLRDALTVMGMAEVWDAIQAMETPEETETGALDEGLDDRVDLRRRWLANSPAQLIATGRQLCAEPDRVAELAAVVLPKHVLSGERDDTWPIPLLDDMAVRLRAHRTIIPGAEHSPNTDQPRATADALIGFWDRIGD
ncbi:alpha/beta fold hydrolase [Streptomyces ipomoeae]|uniref:Hydrolase, alpha/beta domain protein n=1 Tax=Streptomyces ipomoeae 91-03 TaxID=698759 RepID=L1L4X0_9ACTN|nr:alpha/beta hydrolase [Streptomyces ipomoeae]EKX67750.1 hydrolase, alpha/beta domain protein [Streptomyces ipomoeae 91-03]MDX2698708.1 alpha/beta hydrolase [Streptomyces ipomoeae]